MAEGEAWPPVRFRRAFVVPRSVYRVVRRGLTWLWYEKRLGVSTSAPGAMRATAGREGERHAYSPSRWRELARVLPREQIEPGEVFLDLGAGLGRVLVQAAQLPFARVIGVELSSELSELARKNVERMRVARRCGTLEIVTGDAGDYEIPDDVTVVYLYNPFAGSVFQRVVENLLASSQRNPRPIRIIYGCPLEEERLLAAGAILERVHRRWRPSREWTRREETRVYTLAPATQTANPSSSSPEANDATVWGASRFRIPAE